MGGLGGEKQHCVPRTHPQIESSPSCPEGKWGKSTAIVFSNTANSIIAWLLADASWALLFG